MAEQSRVGRLAGRSPTPNRPTTTTFYLAHFLRQHTAFAFPNHNQTWYNCFVELLTTKEICNKRLVFISDLHFDVVRDSSKKKHHAKQYKKVMQADFIKFVKENFANDIMLLGGDFFGNMVDTLDFVAEMERNEIFGFFVLGNHDYWQQDLDCIVGKRQMLTHEQVIATFHNATSTHKHFHFLCTGKKYYVGDLCFIGDTGWTSYRRTGIKKNVIKKIEHLDLPDKTCVADFSHKKILALHEHWIEFANNIIKQEQKVIILTHCPMLDFTEEDKDVWWSSQTELLDLNNQWRIFGHTHKYGTSGHCNLTRQRGYDNKILKGNTPEEREKIRQEIIKQKEQVIEWQMHKKFRKRNGGSWTKADKEVKQYFKENSIPTQIVSEEEIDERLSATNNQYSVGNFGMLIRASDSRELTIPFQSVMQKYYTPTFVEDPNEESKFLRSVKSGGYKRPAANLNNLMYLASDKEHYIARVRKEIIACQEMRKIRIGYLYPSYFDVNDELIQAVNSSIDYLENLDTKDYFKDPRSFITAAVITGYAYNRKMNYLEDRDFRQVNDYDVARFILQFYTMIKHKIKLHDVWQIKRSDKDKIAFMNVDIWLPVIDGKQISVDEAMQIFSNTPLLEYINPDGIIYKQICQGCGHEWERKEKKKIVRCWNCRQQENATKRANNPSRTQNDKDKQRLKIVREMIRELNTDIHVLEYTKGKHAYAKFQCEKCNHIWEQRADHFYRRSICPSCKGGMNG